MEKKVKETEKNALVVANEKKNVEQEAAAIQKEIEIFFCRRMNLIQTPTSYDFLTPQITVRKMCSQYRIEKLSLILL